MFCIKLRRPKEEFWEATLAKIFKILDIYNDEQSMKVALYQGESYHSKYFPLPENESNVIAQNEIKITSMREMREINGGV